MVDMIKCFCCDKTMESEPEYDQDHTTLAPLYDGLWFRAYGNFGSTIHDPVPGLKDYKGFLETAICDTCVVKKGKDGKVSHIYSIRNNPTSKTESLKKYLLASG